MRGETERQEPKGRILKVKLGVNPNSSSMAAVSKVFTWTAISFAFLFNTLTAFFLAARTRNKKNKP